MEKRKPVKPIESKTLSELDLDEDVDFEDIVKAYNNGLDSFETMLSHGLKIVVRKKI